MAERKIAGQTYKVEPMLAREALKMAGRLIKVAGGAWEQLKVELAKPDAGKADITILGASAIVDVVRNNPTDKVVDLITDLAETAMIQAPSNEWRHVDLDGDLTGNLQNLVPIVGFVLEENLGDFFGESGPSGLRNRKAAA